MIVAGCGASILYAFLYRFATVCNRGWWFEKRSVLLVLALFQLGYGTPMVAIFLSNWPSDADSVSYIRQAWP